jgi:hypothetical protein
MSESVYRVELTLRPHEHAALLTMCGMLDRPHTLDGRVEAEISGDRAVHLRMALCALAYALGRAEQVTLQ